MNKSNLRILLLFASLGLLLGVFQHQLLAIFRADEAPGLEAEGIPTLVVPEEGVTSDAFSLKLFHAALALREKGNVCVAPASMVRLLGQMKELSGGATQELLSSLHLPDMKSEALAVNPTHYYMLYADDGLGFKPGIRKDTVMRVPLQRDFTRALTIINNWEDAATAHDGGYLISGEDVSEDTRLIAVANQDFREEWLLPFHLAPTYEQDFYNADGGVAATPTLLSTDAHTVATAADGSWQAAALFFRRAGREGQPCCLIAIMPTTGSARDFARELTVEKLNEIRALLARTSPRQLSLTLPALRPLGQIENLQPLLLEMGLGKLFTKGADFSGIADTPLHLDLAVSRNSLQTSGQDSATGEVEGSPVRFNKPFIWLIGDLISPAPPLFIGLEEQR